MPKSDHTLVECEDAVGRNDKHLRYALADGATEAFDARSWARRLADSWVAADKPDVTREAFVDWVAKQGRRLHESWDGLRLSWYAEEKASAGSFAAFVGVEFTPTSSNASWRAIALGDSCLIQIRKGGALLAWPIANYKEFTASPVLVPSRSTFHASTLCSATVCSGTLEPGDLILLLSDAVACWYLTLQEAGDPKRHSLEQLFDPSAAARLEEVFRDERRSCRIKDDDIAIVAIRPVEI